MGYMRHHAIIVTSFDKERIKLAHHKAYEIFTSPLSDLILSPINDYYSFFIPPDGSKEGWEDSEIGDSLRKEFMDWCDSQRHEDDSNNLEAIEIQYGDGNGDDKIIRKSWD